MLYVLLIIKYTFLFSAVSFYLLLSSITKKNIIHNYNTWPDHVELPPVVEKSQITMLVAVSVAIFQSFPQVLTYLPDLNRDSMASNLLMFILLPD